tara:strand:- start:296 stop:457 length:162 start_codon:yes stop_codon:yes gene_type:complete
MRITKTALTLEGIYAGITKTPGILQAGVHKPVSHHAHAEPQFERTVKVPSTII